MPLPDTNLDWPPPHCRRPAERYREWGAWYSGDRQELAAVYGGLAGGFADPKGLASRRQFRGGVFGRIVRWFWGEPETVGQQPARLHVPLAADIASTSAGLLFGEPPAVVVDPQADPTRRTQGRIDALMTAGGLHAVLLEAAEIAAAYGSAYLRADWDKTAADHPLGDAVYPDYVVPEWLRGRLSAATIWRIVASDRGQVWRHLERHEPGRVLHGLYQGTDGKLGERRPLEAHPDTAPLAELTTDPDVGVLTGSTRLAVVHVPNMRPDRTLRGPLGRSDYAGIEPVLDALDEAWTSWMRDLRLGKGRIIVPDNYLQPLGRGQGAMFDAEREVYAGLAIMTDPDNPRSAITLSQFQIRVEEHQATTEALIAQAVRAAGYSLQTFGEGGDVAMTATEVVSRQQRSYATRARKMIYWRPAITQLAAVLLDIDNTVFNGGHTPQLLPSVEWPDGVTVDPEAQARTLQMLATADAISVRTRVEMLHPDWDAHQVDREAAVILAERDAPAPDLRDPVELVRQAAAAGRIDDTEVTAGTGQPPGRE